MTDIPTFESLSDEQVADIIIEIMGCYVVFREYAAERDGHKYDGIVVFDSNKPDAKTICLKRFWNPMHSLDQCFIFEEWLIDECRHFELDSLNSNWSRYRQNIFEIQGRSIELCIHATASQRCKAFLLTMGKVRE